jgi:hypothetical protein
LISYIKLFGPPILKAIRELEKIAVDMPEVCIMDEIMLRGISPSIARDIGFETGSRQTRSRDFSDPRSWSPDYVSGYFRSSGIPVSYERCSSIISKSGEELGEFDFYFEWLEKPSPSTLNDLIEKIDKALTPLGCLYTITSKK